MAVHTDPLAEQRPWLDGENEFTVRVRQMTWESDGVVSLDLVSDEGHVLPAWQPGAHIDLVLSASLVRQYSLCGSPADTTGYRVAVLREEQSLGGSTFVHDRLRVGQQLRVVGPRNNFGLASAESYLFIAGGIGITPILPMIAAAEEAGVPWRLLYGGARRVGMAFLGELDRWGDRITVFPEDEGPRMDLPTIVADLAPGEHIYACGPSPMLEELEELCDPLPGQVLHLERFMAKAREDTSATDEEISVLCRASDVELSVPADQTILEAMEAAGISWPNSCREGICGSCEAVVCEGVPDHRDSLLSPEEQEAGETLMVCVSRAQTPRLVIDA